MMTRHLPPELPVRTMGPGPVLVLAPHADDEVFGCGGAILRHRQDGTPVSVVVVTDGAHGTPEPERAEVASVRQAESCQAAQVLGCDAPHFWNWRDGEVFFSEALVCAVLEEIERTQARLVYAPSPNELHPDHRAIGKACVEAARRIERPLQIALYEVSGPLNPTHLLDLTDVFALKRAAIACFVSQLAQRPYDRQVTALNQYRTYTLPSQVVAAEAFEVVDNSEIRARTSAGRPWHLTDPTPSPHLQPLITVVVRSTNRSTLREALESIEAQTYESVEVVIVDVRGGGFSPPSCSRSIRVVGSGRPLGRSEAAQVGLDAAEGRWVAFLDDDDYFHPDHLSALAGALRDERLGRVAYSGVECVMQGGEQRTRVRTFNTPFSPLRLLYENYIPINALLFDRTLVDEGCRFDPTLDLYEDWDFLLQLSCRTSFQHLDRITAAYRFPPGSSVGMADPARAEDAAFEDIISKWGTRWTRAQFVDLVRAIRSDRLPRVQELHALLQRSSVQVQDLTRRADRAEGELAEQRDREARLLARAELAESALAEARTHEAREHARAEQSERRLAEIQAQERLERTRAEQAECELAEHRAELLRLSEYLQEREGYIRALLTSRSWRWMSPLRAGFRLVSRR